MSDFISLTEAVRMTTDYRDKRDTYVNSQYSVDILPYSETFEKSQVETLLGQDKCTGVRAYLGVDSNNNIKLVLVGVDDQNEDILTEGNEKILDRAARNPPSPPPSSPLNS